MAGSSLTAEQVSKSRHKLTNESGELIDRSKSGKFYEKWKRSTHLEIPLAGETERSEEAGPTDLASWRKITPRHIRSIQKAKEEKERVDDSALGLRGKEEIRKMREE